MSSSQRSRELILKVGNQTRSLGTLPTHIHSDVRTIVEAYRRRRDPSKSLDQARICACDEALKAASAIDPQTPAGLNFLADQVKQWEAIRKRKFDAEQHYDSQRTLAYTQGNEGCQRNLARVAFMLGGQAFDSSSRDSCLLLDVGCGSGLSARNYSIGVDLSTSMLVANKASLDVVRADMSQPSPFRDGCFDAVYSISAVHYLLEDSTFMSSYEKLECFFTHLRRVLRKDSSSVIFQLFPEGGERDMLRLSATAESFFPQTEKRLILDHPHHTAAYRWFYSIGSRDADPRYLKCLVWRSRAETQHASCLWLMLKARNEESLLAKSEEAKHLEWVKVDHCRWIRKLIRTLNRIEAEKAAVASAAAEGTTLEKKKTFVLPVLPAWEEAIAQQARTVLGPDVSLEQLRSNWIDRVYEFAHPREVSPSSP